MITKTLQTIQKKKNLKTPKIDTHKTLKKGLESKKTETVNSKNKCNLKNNSDWLELFDLLSLSPFARNYFGNLSFLSFEESLITLVQSEEENNIPENVFKEFQTVLNVYYGYEIEVEIKQGDNNNSPLNHKKKIESDRQSKAEKDVLSDPSIQKFLDKYDGNIKDGSIKPVN